MYEMQRNGGEVDVAELRQARQRSSAPDVRQYRGVYMTRLVLRILSLLTCVAIAIVLAKSIQSYVDTRDVTNPFRDGSGQMPVWPDNLKLYPSFILLGAAIFAGLLSLLLVLASFIKSVRRMTTTGNVPTIIISSVCLVMWATVTAYYGTWDSRETNWDLLSWSCTHQDPKYDYKNIDFSQFCTKMRFAFWAGVGLAGLEALNLALFLVWCITTRRARGYQKMEDGKASSHTNWVPNVPGL